MAFLVLFTPSQVDDKINQKLKAGKEKVESESREANLVSARTSSLHMNLLPGDTCPSPSQLPAEGRSLASVCV